MAIVSEVMIIMSIGATIMANAGDNDRGVGPLLIKGTIGGSGRGSMPATRA
jgi:hypothetical protein